MALLSVIRRWHLRDGHSIREIARRTGQSRNTIRKYLRSDEVAPRFQVPERPSKLDSYAERLSAWLRTEANRPRKQKRTIKQLHADLMSLGYEGSYGRVAAFARTWKEERQRQMQTSGRGRRAHEATGGALQAELQPCLCRASLSPSDAQDAV